MKTELFEKMIRKIVREELDFYATKILKEIADLNSKSLLVAEQLVKNSNHGYINANVPVSQKTALRESLMGFKEELDKEYGINNGQKITFDGMEVPPELDAVFNKDYSDFMKKLKK